jgi:hypothetical protein
MTTKQSINSVLSLFTICNVRYVMLNDLSGMGLDKPEDWPARAFAPPASSSDPPSSCRAAHES